MLGVGAQLSAGIGGAAGSGQALAFEGNGSSVVLRQTDKQYSRYGTVGREGLGR